jgi:CheY-like chemotaxis protein
MPNMDGLDLARKIKADPALKGAQLVMLTSLGHLPEERLWRECGIAAYLVKPVKESRLYDTLITVLRGIDPSRGPKSRGELLNLPGEQAKKSFRILVAEDNMVNQKVALRQLQKLGYSADAVANGFEVIKAIERIPYDIILMDCQMPELDGYEATRRIRTEESENNSRTRPRQYIIAMTANALAGDREECLSVGMNDYITKPVRMDELDAALLRGIEFLNTAHHKGSPDAPAGDGLDENILRGLRDLRMEGEPDPIAELVELFLQDTPARLSRVEVAFQSGNFSELESAAHSLKGSAGNLGATRLASLCAELVQAARQRRTPEAALVQKLRSEFERVIPLLHQVCLS